MVIEHTFLDLNTSIIKLKIRDFMNRTFMNSEERGCYIFILEYMIMTIVNMNV